MIRGCWTRRPKWKNHLLYVFGSIVAANREKLVERDCQDSAPSNEEKRCECIGWRGAAGLLVIPWQWKCARRPAQLGTITSGDIGCFPCSMVCCCCEHQCSETMRLALHGVDLSWAGCGATTCLTRKRTRTVRSWLSALGPDDYVVVGMGRHVRVCMETCPTQCRGGLSIVRDDVLHTQDTPNQGAPANTRDYDDEHSFLVGRVPRCLQSHSCRCGIINAWCSS